MKFNKDPFSGSRVVRCGRTVVRTRLKIKTFVAGWKLVFPNLHRFRNTTAHLCFTHYVIISVDCHNTIYCNCSNHNYLILSLRLEVVLLNACLPFQKSTFLGFFHYTSLLHIVSKMFKPFL